MVFVILIVIVLYGVTTTYWYLAWFRAGKLMQLEKKRYEVFQSMIPGYKSIFFEKAPSSLWVGYIRLFTSMIIIAPPAFFLLSRILIIFSLAQNSGHN